MKCIHKFNADYCPICKPPPSIEDLSEERRSIVLYLEWAASVELGTVLSPEQREGVRYAASWVKNQLDRQPRE